MPDGSAEKQNRWWAESATPSGLFSAKWWPQDAGTEERAS